MKIVITGGAGFVGSNLAVLFKTSSAYPNAHVVVLDNLKRRGSELNLTRFKSLGIEFLHGDIRNPSDFESLNQNFDLMIDASAEPSVLAGLDGSPRYLIDTNLLGTVNSLEFARKNCGSFLFLSTSRVYSIQPLCEIPLDETDSRFEIKPATEQLGLSAMGVTESFPTHLPRSLYGATKLASELLIQEYAATYGMKAIINRCGVIAGPGQFGKVDQGVFTMWVANHFFKHPLRYTGFGGTGKQVRDLLHPNDLFDLIHLQMPQINSCSGQIFNVGGGRSCSVSLLEMTQMCREKTGNSVKIHSINNAHAVDIPLYISDNSKVNRTFGWKPKYTPHLIVTEIADWLQNNEKELAPLFNVV